MEDLRRRSGSVDYRAATGAMRDILVKVINEGYEDQLRQVRSPIMLLWGESDDEVPISVARNALDIVRQSGGDADLKVLEGVGHHVPIEAPEELRKAIESLLP
jgi:pimeloyl-ACP methyl ester carboxylesterase